MSLFPPNGVPECRGRVSPVVAGLLGLVGAVPYLGSLFMAIVELGDLPYVDNDWLQDRLLAGWLFFFGAAVFAAWMTRDRPTSWGVTLICGVLTVVGLFFAL